VVWLFSLLALVLVVGIALVVVGGETARLADAARPAVMELYEAVDYIADRLPESAQARLTHDDVRWILLTDADGLEHVVDDEDEVEEEGIDDDLPLVIDEVDAIARILVAADRSGRDVDDEDVAAVLAGRTDYLQAIGAVGPEAR
jgi:hypothetical protein